MITLPGPTPMITLRGEAAVGCVAVRRLDDSTCEMKRLYVAPSERGRGVGLALARAALISARSLGYQTIRLDTLVSMTAAQKLYRSLGFHETPPYNESPHPTVYMARSLT